MSFVHLHTHTQYSLLDGFSEIKKLVARAKAMEMPAVAISDHGTMLGVVEFYTAATAIGIKPIIGLETYMAARRRTDKESQLDRHSNHLLLLSENQTGYLNLIQIATESQLNGFYYVPRIDQEFLAEHSEGLIATTACISGQIPRALQNGETNRAEQLLRWHLDVFGDRFYLELQDHAGVPELKTINRQLIELGKKYNVPLVATNDVHYVNREDARLQDILLAIQTNRKLTDAKRLKHDDDSYYLRPADEMSALFSEVPEAINNSLLIAERCNVSLKNKGYHLPEFPVPEGYNAESYLRELCFKGLVWRYGEKANNPEVQERINYELGVIHNMGFDSYFLIVWDLTQYAKRSNIWYNVRGSGAGSMVAYTLGITAVEPLGMKLIFERFLNPGRISMPDIDLDFQDDLRPRVMAYCAEKYGNDHVASIITFSTMGGKSAIRDVGRVLDIPLADVDRIAKAVPSGANAKPLVDAVKEVPELGKEYENPTFRELLDLAAQMEGTIRGVGTHAAGVVITDKPLTAYGALHRPTGNADEVPIKQVIQFEMGTVDKQGLLKVDFLGLKTLTIMQRASTMIEKRHGVHLDLSNIPTDDPAIYELLGKGDTAGVFQVESAGMRKYLQMMKPERLDHIIAMVALYRPGPLDFIPGYIKRMHNEEEVEYRHPDLAEYFADSYGTPVYQEQLMFTVRGMAGYTMSEADDFRKAISKKNKEKIAEHREKFIKGASTREKNPVDPEVAAAIFNDWEGFARYAFNKAHAADYGIICAQTAYLKAHYAIEYMTALLSVMGHDSKEVAKYVAECRRLGIKVVPPSVNSSELDFIIEDENRKSFIRFGMRAIKNVGDGPVAEIIRARSDRPFASLADFVQRVDARKINRRVLESLIKSGAMDCIGDRNALLKAMKDVLKNTSKSKTAKKAQGQLSIEFEMEADNAVAITSPSIVTNAMKKERLAWERELLGLYVSDHPLSPYVKQLAKIVSHYSGDLGEEPNGTEVRVAGAVMSVRTRVIKSGREMANVVIEDAQGEMDVVIFPNMWEDHKDILTAGNVLVFWGKLDVNEQFGVKVCANRISSDLSEPEPGSPEKPRVVAPAKRASDHDREAKELMRKGSEVPLSTATCSAQEDLDVEAIIAESLTVSASEAAAPNTHRLEVCVDQGKQMARARLAFQAVLKLCTAYPGQGEVVVRFNAAHTTHQLALPNIKADLYSAGFTWALSKILNPEEYRLV